METLDAISTDLSQTRVSARLHSAVMPVLKKPSLLAKVGGRFSMSDMVFGSERIASSGIKKGVDTVGHHFGAEFVWALPVTVGALALLSEWDHHNQKNHIKREYAQEIAALTGKPPHAVNVGDLERVAKENPVIGDAVNRSRLRRNLSVAITVVGTVGALALGAALAPSIAGLGIVAALGAHSAAALGAVGITASAGGISGTVAAVTASTLSFLGIEKVMEKVGEKKLHLEEPELKAVYRRPERQGELSVSSQVAYLEHLRARQQHITQEQVMTLFAAADPEMDARVQRKYGVSFAKLPESAKQQAVQLMGADYDIGHLTEEINNHKIRVQELAFTAVGQKSGVARFEAPQLREAQNHAHALEQENAALRAQLHGKGNKLAMHNAAVEAAVPGYTEARRADNPQWGLRTRESQRQAQVAGIV